MSEQNGLGTKEHIAKLNILIESKATAEDLMPAVAYCLVDVLQKLEEREERQKEIDTVLFGNEKMKVTGLLNDAQPIIKMYKKFGWLTALLWIPLGYLLYLFFDYIKIHLLK